MDLKENSKQDRVTTDLARLKYIQDNRLDPLGVVDLENIELDLDTIRGGGLNGLGNM